MLGAAPKQAPTATVATTPKPLGRSKRGAAAFLAAFGLVLALPAGGGAYARSQSSAAMAKRASAPTVPTGLATRSVQPTSVVLSWKPSSAPDGIAGYRLFLDGSRVGTTTKTSFRYTGLSCGTAYRLAVAAYDRKGNLSQKAVVSNSTSACPDTQPPSTPSGLTTSSVAQSSLSLSWRASSDNVGVAGYWLFLDGSFVGDSSSTSYAFAALACGTTYTIGVAAYDAAGNASGTASTVQATAGCPDTQAPSAPTALATSSVGPTSTTLTWAAATDNVGIAGYRLFLNGAQVGATGSPGYSYGGLSCGTSYTLGVAAYDAAGNVSPTATVSQATSPCAPTDTRAPSTPTGLSSGSATQTSIPLSWTASTDDVGVAGYRLFLNGSQVATTGSTGYSFTGLSCGTSYSLGAAAYDAAGNVSATASISAATSPCTAPPPPGQVAMAFDLGWAPSPNMPWNDLTQAILFALQTKNGTGLDASDLAGVNVASWVAAAHLHGVQALISIGGIDDQHWQDACNDANRAQFVQNLVNYAVNNGFDGIDLDIEDDLWSSQGPPSPAMTTCVEAAAGAAHAATSKAGHRLFVSQDITTNWMGPWAAPSQSYIDQFNLMTYGDNLSTLAADVQDTYDQGLPYGKMVVGIDVDDYAEPSGGCSPYADYARQHGLLGAFVWDAVSDNNHGNACMNAVAAGA